MPSADLKRKKLNDSHFQRMKMLKTKSFLAIFFMIWLPEVSIAEITMPAFFSDHMVLQSQIQVPIWGTCDPDKAIEVKLNSVCAQTTSDTSGKWKIVLPPLPAGGPYEMLISGNGSVTITDVLIGEVWLCSGQSNMARRVNVSKDYQKEAAAANYPQIRFFKVEQAASDTPLSDVVGHWKICSPETVGVFAAVPYYFGRELHQKLNVPIGLISSSVGGTHAHPWIKKETLAQDNILKRYIEQDMIDAANKDKYQKLYEQWLAEWEKNVEIAKNQGQTIPDKPKLPRGLNPTSKSSCLYNAMIHPLIPYAIKGFIWYQGESNTHRPDLYKILFPALIKSWRQDWQQGDIPFYYVQLSSFGKFMKKDSAGLPDFSVPCDSDWASLRQVQIDTLSLPNTGMAVTIDIGDINDVHPLNKQDVGKRLALWALAKDYGFKNIVYSGPLYKNMKIEDNTVRLFFEHIGSGLVAKGNSIKGFAIAGNDKKFVWANAKIDGDTVLVWSDQIKNPVEVRYGWADWINCNLYNKEDLPASPFKATIQQD